jgi:hypothetical protein
MRLAVRRTVAAVLAGSALVLSSAASCGPTGDDDDQPGVVQPEGDDDGEGDGDD